jgi:hypothetical protein
VLANRRASEGHSRGITGHWYGMTWSEKREDRDPLERATMARCGGTARRGNARAYARGGMRVGIRERLTRVQVILRVGQTRPSATQRQAPTSGNTNL